MHRKPEEADERQGATDQDCSSPMLWTVNDLAKALQISTRCVWRLKSSGKLPQPVVVGGSIRWKRDEVHDWVKRGCPAIEVRRKGKP